MIGLYTLTSPLHDEAAVNAASAAFVSEIENLSGYKFEFHGSDFTLYGSDDLSLIYVRTGGTEGLFQEVFANLDGPILLLTSGRSNSLAASMEILSFLNQQGRSGEIIHGSVSYIAERIKVLAQVAKARKVLRGSRLGVIGAPSDWLISSTPDASALYERLGIELVDVPISELVEEYHLTDFGQGSEVADKAKAEFESHAPAALQKYSEGAFKIYCALKSLIRRYELNGLTLRCFDLLDSLGNTGCLALAILNAEGIPAGCEGDVPALVSMTIGSALTGVSGFQANPSRIDPQTGEILFAHCTVPLNMLRSYTFNTHFESGIGIAISGNIPVGDATVFKVSGDLNTYFCCPAELLKCQSEASLCRTQAVLKIKGDAEAICRDYFLKKPVGNHHIIFPGDHHALFEAFMARNLTF
jgi:L-fucose isomerase-like protein